MSGCFFKTDDAEIEAWRRANNSAIGFFEDNCCLDKKYMCSSREMYLEYKHEWNLDSAKLNEKNFISQIKNEYKLQSKRIRINNNQMTVLIGCYCNKSKILIT